MPSVLMTSLPPGDPMRAQAPCPVLHKPFQQAELARRVAEMIGG